MNWIEMPPFHHLRAFKCIVQDGQLAVLVGREPAGAKGEMRWHLSISHRGTPAPGRIPTWDEIKDARYRFCPDQTHMAMILPPRAEYVNVHPTTMHLYEISEGL